MLPIVAVAVGLLWSSVRERVEQPNVNFMLAELCGCLLCARACVRAHTHAKHLVGCVARSTGNQRIFDFDELFVRSLVRALARALPLTTVARFLLQFVDAESCNTRLIRSATRTHNLMCASAHWLALIHTRAHTLTHYSIR